ncbi:MAG TPA: hypothetical protein VFI03_06130 [Solirubrobacterales bacterium]|nr:hypothetical protein [Solirubrobacterales bacterium]
MRGVQKLLLAVAFALLMATAFVACGSDDSSSDSNATTPQETAPTTPSDEDGGIAKKETEPGDDHGASSGSDDAAGEDSSSSSGEASAAFRTPGGDNSIQNFGEEAGGEEVEAASATLRGFMEARAASDWGAACTHLAAAAIKPLEDLASKSPQLKDKGCAAILAALVQGAPASTRANSLTDGIASLRVEGDRGFALYHGPKGINYFMTMTEEDGEWKVGSLAPTEFP